MLRDATSMLGTHRNGPSRPLWTLCLAGLVACQAAPAQSPEPAATTPANADSSAPTEPPPVDDDAVVPTEPDPPAPVPAAVDTRVQDACAKLCARKEKDCPSYEQAACEADCALHEQKAGGCEAQVEAALLCQADAAQSPCANVAAGACIDAFVQMQRCQRGEPMAPVASPSSEPPPGWETFRDDTWGVSITMPANAQVDANAASRTWRASLDGTDYEVRELARPKKLDDNAFIKLVIAHVGVACQKNMRLTGRVDSAAFVSMDFETGCSQGPRLFGKLRIDDDRALSLLVRGSSTPEQRLTFFDGVR